jgi:hypothetical protein
MSPRWRVAIFYPFSAQKSYPSSEAKARQLYDSAQVRDGVKHLQRRESGRWVTVERTGIDLAKIGGGG